MGAMAPPPHWLPEDDVLLKNALEAGASLESLAKGAVQFSRRFSVQELHDRWLSLLYDPVISVEASALMIEVERSAFPNQWRPNKLEGGKALGCSSGKRKGESIRKCYYAMRKRISNEPLGWMGINLQSDPVYSNFGDGNELSSADCRTENPDLNNLRSEGPDFDLHYQSFPESTGIGGAPSFNSIENHGNDLHLGGEDVPHDPAYSYEGNITLNDDCSEVPGFNQSKELSLCNMFEAEGLVNQEGACSEVGGLPFSSFGCSTPPPQMSDWPDSQEISVANIPIPIGEKDQQTIALDYLAELSSTLFDLADTDSQLFMDTDANDALEKTYLDSLSSLLLDSPSQRELPTPGSGEVTVATDEHLVTVATEENFVTVVTEEHLVDSSCAPNRRTNAQLTPASTVKCLGPEYRNGVICCTLNTEDLMVPSNDDVFLPYRCPSPSDSSGAHWRLHQPSYLVSSSVEEFSISRKAYGVAPIRNDPFVPPQMIGSLQSSDMGLRYPTGEHGVKFELPESSIDHAALRNARNSECPNRVSSEIVNANNFSGIFDRCSMDVEQGKNTGYKSLGTYPDNGLGGKAETLSCGSLNAELSLQQTTVLRPIDQSLVSGQEELCSESEFDVPYFSDVEAMILGMDLSPDEFDLFTTPEVQQYQHEETKRTIIRLEQAAHACTQRAIAGQGAFAVLYGRCSKYFIKKPEVLIGRVTDDTKVDIDLGREKNGGKISRRQAIMKLDMHGIFHLKNMGKTSINVNDKAVAPGQSLSLTSGCLIEIRGLTFLFETNHRSIKQHVDSIGQGGLLVDQKPPLTR